MGILNNAMGRPDDAEASFILAQNYDKNNPEVYYHYANWLLGRNRIDEAKKNVDQALVLSPAHSSAKSLLAIIISKVANTLTAQATDALENPSADKYINLSLAYYKKGLFVEAIEACNNALEINPKLPVAYNNMCSALNQLKKWEEAEAACLKAVALDANYQLAKNNLRWAQTGLRKTK
jgi:tetratricopeptide (TPR) repeat protein